MSLPSNFDNEINALTREFSKQQPYDILQFCANHFLRRLEAQRAEFLPGGAHSSPEGGTTMAESNFPGSNPFRTGSTTADRGIHRVDEEEEHEHINSPTAPVFRSVDMSGNTESIPPPAPSASTFGSSGFMAGNRLHPMEDAGLPVNYNYSRRVSVSAESMNPTISSSDNWTPPFHQKTPEQHKRLRAAVSPNFLFSHLDDDQTHTILSALKEKPIPTKGIKVITQGDVGDYFYVVEKGSFDIYVNPALKIEPGPEGMGKKVASIGPGGSFGELALMYNSPRAATVISTEPSTLWALDGITFRRILMDSAFQRRQMYEQFLAEVPLLESLTSYERSKIADALSTQKYPAGHTIIEEGDPGESFFILESGEAEVFKKGKEGPIHKYRKGDYFGELALLNDKPRAASVVSVTEIKLATLGKDGFQRLMGPVEDLMRRNDPSQTAGEEVDPLAKPA